jgi:membrane protein
VLISRLRAAAAGWSEDEASQMGAALAYYALFSLTPLLVLAIALIGALVGEAEAKQHILTEVRHFIDADSAAAVRAMLESFSGAKGRAATSVVGIASLLFGATGMFTSLRASLSRIWRLPPVQESLIVGWVKTYLLAFLMVFVSCTFFIALLLVSAILPLVYRAWAETFPGVAWAGPTIDFAASTLLLMLLFAFTYRFLSDGRLSYGQVWLGAFVGALLFSAGKLAIGSYLAYANLASVYGAAGSLVAFLAWVYYSAQIFFFGAEVIRAGLPAATAEPAK